MANEEDLIEYEKDITQKQKLFCEYYVCGDKELFGNGVQSYIEAYEPDTSVTNWYKSACSSASRLLSNVKVIEEINRLLELNGLNDVAVDKQLSFLITQHSDFSSKISAIREYNKLRQRITEKHDVTSKGEQITTSNEQFEQLLRAANTRGTDVTSVT